MPETLKTAEPLEVLIVEIAGRRYGLPAASVNELQRAAAIVPLDDAPGVEGLVNLHGTVAPVVDLRSRLHLPAKAIEPGDYFVVVAIDSRPAVLHVDRTLDLVRLGPQELDGDGALAAPAPGVSRVARLPGEILPILDLETILSRPDAAGFEQTAGALRPAARKEPPA